MPLEAITALSVEDADDRVLEICVRWKGRIVDIKRMRDVDNVAIGTARGCDIFVPLDAGPVRGSHVLLRARNRRWVVNPLPLMRLSVCGRGDAQPLSNTAGVFAVEDDTFVEVGIGDFTLELRRGVHLAAVPVDEVPRDRRGGLAALATALSFTAVVAVLACVPVAHRADAAPSVDEPDERRTHRYREIRLAAYRSPDVRGWRMPRSRPMQVGETQSGPTTPSSSLSRGRERRLATLFSRRESHSPAPGAEPKVHRAGVRPDDSVDIGSTRRNTMRPGAIRALLKRPAPAPLGVQNRMTVEGALNDDVILRVVRAHIDDLRRCYERTIQTNQRLNGNIMLRWVIASGGLVSYATVVLSSVEDKTIERCIWRRVIRWRFPKPKDGEPVVVTLPIVFQSP